MTEQGRHRNLITGATGFAGCYLVEALLASGQVAIGLSRRAVWPSEWARHGGRAELLACDLTVASSVEAVLRRVRPTRIYHLAGYARTGASFKDAELAWAGNLHATRALCEAVIRTGERPRILFVGSGLIYGDRLITEPACNEEAPLRPDSPYAASKAAADLARYQYARARGLDIVRARPFNHVGPHQGPQFAIPDFVSRLVAIERGEAPPVIETGNLTPSRDFTDVRDMTVAYLLLMERGRSGEAYNIASGHSTSMQEVLSSLIALSGLQVEVRQRAERLRPTEPLAVRVDADKLRRETLWQPRYSLEETLRDTLAASRRAGRPPAPGEA